jgi:hypothetical protein
MRAIGVRTGLRSQLCRPGYVRRTPFQTESGTRVLSSPEHRPLARGPDLIPGRRQASTGRTVAAESGSLVTRLKNLFLGTAIGAFLVLGYFYVTDTRAGFHRWVVVPCLRWIYPDAEEAHEAGNKALRMLHEFGLHPRERGDPDKAGDLRVEVSWGDELAAVARADSLRCLVMRFPIQ